MKRQIGIIGISLVWTMVSMATERDSLQDSLNKFGEGSLFEKIGDLYKLGTMPIVEDFGPVLQSRTVFSNAPDLLLKHMHYILEEGDEVLGAVKYIVPLPLGSTPEQSKKCFYTGDKAIDPICEFVRQISSLTERKSERALFVKFTGSESQRKCSAITYFRKVTLDNRLVSLVFETRSIDTDYRCPASGYVLARGYYLQ